MIVGLVKKLFFVALLFGAFLWYQPYRTVINLTRALENENPQAVETYVDFAAVREAMTTQAAGPKQDAIGSIIGRHLAGAVVDAVVTPQTMVSVLKDKDKRDRLGFSATFGDILAHGTWNGPDAFILHDDKGDPTAVLQRRGLNWVVTALYLK